MIVASHKVGYLAYRLSPAKFLLGQAFPLALTRPRGLAIVEERSRWPQQPDFHCVLLFPKEREETLQRDSVEREKAHLATVRSLLVDQSNADVALGSCCYWSRRSTRSYTAYTKVAVQSGASTSKHTPLCFQTKRKPPSIEIKSKHHEWGGYL